jgi:hypothetical protein
MDAATTATGQVADIRDTEQGRAERGGLTGRIQMEREREMEAIARDPDLRGELRLTRGAGKK